jgi:RNA polymerase sigma-70 factor (ECF subfamily)
MPVHKLHAAIELPFPARLAAEERAAGTAIADRVLLLFDECGPGLRRYVGSFNLGAAATEDVVQDVFLALFRHLAAGRPDSNLKGWLFQVAHNLALKQRQRSLRRLQTEASWDGELAERVLDGGANPEERLAGAQRQQRLTEALRLMPERDRHCVCLRAEGLTYRDIARTLGVSLGSVAKSMVRAIARLTAADME